MSEQPQVVVRGEAVLTVLPEVAELAVTVRVSARDRQTAIERCGARSAEVTRVIAAAGDAVETADTAAVSVHLERYDQGPATPVASVQTRLVLRPEAAGNLLVALGELDDVLVDGPWWRLSASSTVPEEARLAAIDDAVRRARLYAGAFGAEITGLVEVADAGLSRPGGAGLAGREIGVAAAFEASGPRLELTPQQLRVHGSVEVRFAMSAPDPEVFRR